MIIDSSAIVAIVLGEADGDAYVGAIADAETRLVSAVNWLESAMVADRKGTSTTDQHFATLWSALAIDIVPFTPDQAVVARDAWRRYGKGSGHKAQLNFGDCMAYALARERGEPLLFKGGEFNHTDIEPALRD